MNKLIIKTVLLLIISLQLRAQDTIYFDESNLKQYIKEISDTFNSLSRCAGCVPSVHATNSETFGYIVSKKYLQLQINYSADKIEAIVNYMDSLSKTTVYSNKILADEFYGIVISHWNSCWNCIPEISDQQLKLINKMIISDIENCMKYNGTINISNLRHENITNELIKKLKVFLKNYNTRTQEEAEMYAKRKDPLFKIDTTGYALKKLEYKKGKKENEKYIEKIDSWIKVARSHHMGLMEYLDSLQAIEDKLDIDGFLNGQVDIQPIIRFIGDNYLHAFNKELESFYKNPEKDKIPYVSEFSGIVLARLGYKNYEKMVISGLMDNFYKIKDNDDYTDIFNQLLYINTNISYSFTYPFLSLETKYYDGIIKNYIPDKYYFLTRLNGNITNLPWEYNQLKLAEINRDSSKSKLIIFPDWLFYNPPSDEVFLTIIEWLKNHPEEIIIANKVNN